MDWNSILPTFKSLLLIGLTSGFFAAIISTLCNIFIAKINNKNSSTLEKEKYKQSINDYRYKELSGHLEKIIDIISSFDSSWKNYMDEHNKLSPELFINHINKISSYLDKLYHLLDPDYSKQLQEKYHEILDCEKRYLNSIENDNAISLASEFVVQVLDFDKQLTKTIQDQLTKLLQITYQ